MAPLKTQPTKQDVSVFIEEFASTEQKKQDSYALIELIQRVTGFAPYMWGPSIIGFGSYHYKYDSGHEGDAPVIGFSPRKAAISLYVYSGADGQSELLQKLGKFKMGKACIYVTKLANIDTTILTKLIQSTVKHLQEKYN